MSHESTPSGPCHLVHLERTRRTVMSARELRAHGMTGRALAERTRPGGPWRELLPQVYLLHEGPASGEEWLRAALLYAGRPPRGQEGGGEAMLTGPAALALHGFASVPEPPGLGRIDVLVPRRRRLRDTGPVRLRRAPVLPRPVTVAGLPCAPVPRALADAVEQATDTRTVRTLLVESVRDGHCEAARLVRELTVAGLLERPHVTAAVAALHAEARSAAEGLLYEMVSRYGLPDPVWNVELRLPGGPAVAVVDAYWPQQAVAVVLDGRGVRHDELERLGVTVVTAPVRRLRGSAAWQAAAVRTALVAAEDREPHAYLVVLPR
ncbi:MULTISPECIES: hypothetical protein [Streptomycetaceae]|uniref:Transcriptional regulator n=1 Tax=Streptantibioticus cattleyicolor (strain ATCC 35852 / DSM 46488 / JCM 4925 / NBRC 14057 / NRRL 8057) TaxID=1003195 RepID=F8JR30_STREN|nr:MULTISPECIES: hypothetical protein [Streptomycetaceae]AEW94122.1 hypothetical protein SCATT_17510 [Streptantibioticus cattleyicolor NRRL 8057 = DSM 46488]MYS58788.1 hypothetical protein [Streptomyces sp. SID5468]CCB74476.1 conserved protein of unknown function [Streptantibioticus cattleyicolor NRRL 8057 = DSM 46488]